MITIRSSVLTVALAICLSVPALADARVKSIFVKVINSATTEANLRTDVYNPSRYVQRGPISVKLYVRGNDHESWRHIHTYPAITMIKAGQHVARDYFVPAHGVDPAIASGQFQVRATSSLPNGTLSEMIVTQDI